MTRLTENLPLFLYLIYVLRFNPLFPPGLMPNTSLGDFLELSVLEFMVLGVWCGDFRQNFQENLDSKCFLSKYSMCLVSGLEISSLFYGLPDLLLHLFLFSSEYI